MTAHIRQFLDKIDPARFSDLPYFSPTGATPAQIENCARFVADELKYCERIAARAAVIKLNEYLTVQHVEFDSDDVVAEIRVRADMVREQREGDR